MRFFSPLERLAPIYLERPTRAGGGPQEQEARMRINGTRVTKSKVEVSGYDWMVTLYGQSPRGTPILLGAFHTTKVTMANDLAKAPETFTKAALRPAPESL